MSNPFDDTDGSFLVLINDEGQHSLWPAFADVPAGWNVALTAAGKQECLDWVEAHWSDLRPESLIASMV
jgi:MbtH protein